MAKLVRVEKEGGVSSSDACCVLSPLVIFMKFLQ